MSTFLPDEYLSAAAAFARRHRLPLVLLCHDDYEASNPPSIRPQLRAIYRQAAARLCVSEPMAMEFEKRYGAKGEVLHPIPSGPARAPVPEGDAQLRIGFAGNVGHGYEEAAIKLADAVAATGGRFFVVSPTPRERLPRFWSHPALDDLGQVAPDQVSLVFRQASVNVLAVVQSFDPREQQAFALNFPSKLTEYTTFGLPVLIVAPAGASAVNWAQTQSDEVAVISSDAIAELAAAMQRLADPAARFKLARAFYRAGAQFDPDHLQAAFERALDPQTLLTGAL